jgi:RimJ/RimL family protein N-acetyltransferase
MLLGPTIETKRLILRPPQLADLDQWIIADDENDVTRNSRTPEDNFKHHTHLLQIAGGWALNAFGSLQLFKKDDGVLIGRVGPSKPLDWPAVEIGWMLLPEYTGRGYALEGAVAAMDFALMDLRFNEVIHTIRPSNMASQKLATKLGSTNRGPIKLPPPYQDIPNDGWYQSREEWAVNRLAFDLT